MKFPKRILYRLAPFSVAVVVGCASAPPDGAFEERAAAAGVRDPIRFVTSPMPVDAGVADDAEITLEEAVRRTLENDPAVQAALARTRVALADARQARLLPNPVVSVAFRFPEGGGKPIIDAGLTADLISLLLKPRQTSAADHRLRAASSEALTVVLDTVAEVQERYATVQALDARMGTLDERTKLVRRLLDLAKARLDAGEAGRLDVITLDGERAALDVEVMQTALERREQRLVLARLLGQPSSAADWKLSEWSAPQPVSMSESALIAAALERRPEVQARRWELAALGDEVAVAGFASLEGSEVGVEAERDGPWSVGPAAAVPIPLLDWGQAHRAKTEAERIEGRHRLTQTNRQVVEEVRRAYEALRASEAVMAKVRMELVPLSEQRREQAEASYRSGFGDITAVLLAEQDAQGARAKLIELQQKASSARFRLERAAGGPGVIAVNRANTRPSREHP